MNFETITLERKASVGVITMNRPDAMNAICALMLYEIAEALVQFDAEESIRAVILKGAGRTFAAGSDMTEFAEKPAASFVKDGIYGKSVTLITSFKKPLIAAVDGYAFGGGLELVLFSDIVIASDSARFGFPEISLGVLPQMGGISRLIARVGRPKAMEMILTGRHLSAQEAADTGLVSRLVSTENLLDEAVQTAERIALLPMAGILLAKQAARAGSEYIENAEHAELLIARLSLMSEDASEALKALTEKRQPQFNHQ